MSLEGQGPTARILYGPVQFSANLVLSTFASVPTFAPWRIMKAVLYSQTQLPTTQLGTWRKASRGG